MKSIPQKIDTMLWSNDDQFYNNVGYSAPYISFVKMQIIRLFWLLAVLVIWCLNFYINVKKVVIYFNFWALSFTLLALAFLFVSSGRQVIERKLAENGEPVPENEKSSTWKTGLLFYTLAWPFVVVSNLTFFIFFHEDQICQTYIDFGFEQWRAYVLIFSVLVPALALLSDFFTNRLVMSYKHLIVNVVFLALYLFLTFLGSTAQNRPVYGNHLGYLPHNNFQYQYNKPSS